MDRQAGRPTDRQIDYSTVFIISTAFDACGLQVIYAMSNLNSQCEDLQPNILNNQMSIKHS